MSVVIAWDQPTFGEHLNSSLLSWLCTAHRFLLSSTTAQEQPSTQNHAVHRWQILPKQPDFDSETIQLSSQRHGEHHSPAEPAAGRALGVRGNRGHLQRSVFQLLDAQGHPKHGGEQPGFPGRPQGQEHGAHHTGDPLGR